MSVILSPLLSLVILGPFLSCHPETEGRRIPEIFSASWWIRMTGIKLLLLEI